MSSKVLTNIEIAKDECVCLCLCSPDEMFASVNCGVINESTVHHRKGREEERDVEKMKKLCLIRPTHKTDHPMGTESTASLDTLTSIIILLRQGETNGKRGA